MQPNQRGTFHYFPDGTAEICAELTTTLAAAAAIAAIPVQPDTTIVVRLEIAAHRRSNGDGAGYFIVATFKRIAAGNVAQVGATAALATQEDDAAYAITFTPGTTSVDVNVASGAAAEVQWSMKATILPCRLK